MGREDKATWKANYFVKIVQLLDEYPKCFIVGADNVGSRQMQTIRISLRGTAVVLMGKNTMMRKAIRGHLEENSNLEKLLPHIKGNVGFVFTKGDLVEVRDKLMESKVRAPARAGAIAPLEVIIPAQNTGLGPEKTSFFQALSIPTKISKGTIEIINDVPILKPGDKVGASEATLLNMLNISPFSYGLQIEQVYDSGSIFSPDILDIKPEDLRAKFQAGVANLAAVSLEIGYPTLASVPHSIANGFRNLLAIAAVTEVEFKEADLERNGSQVGHSSLELGPEIFRLDVQNVWREDRTGIVHLLNLQTVRERRDVQHVEQGGFGSTDFVAWLQNGHIVDDFNRTLGNLGLGPEKTSFFQALSIPTKISKGTIEIINDVPILKPGDKVGASEATLLNMLNISPFSYGLQIEQVYDSGSIFSPDILDIKPEDLRAKFQAGVANLAAVSLEIGYPTLASVPHSIANGFRNLLAIAAVTEVEFKEAETVKEFIKDPSKFAAAAAPTASAAAAAPAAAAKEAPKEESESEDDDMGFGLFD
uniref:Large ribosomal subunit protein uL10 n=1 Tax=Aedes albopictus TaxID=7160 RepID=A0A023EUQ6_AEDAL